MKISQNGIDLIKKYEGFKDRSYVCPAGVRTIGYGTTRINGRPVQRGMSCTRAQAEGWLRNDADDFLDQIEPMIRDSSILDQNQIDALASFVYNVGIGNFKKSNLLKHINDGFLVLAADEFKRWNKGGGRVLAGLVDRREEEAELFRSFKNDKEFKSEKVKAKPSSESDNNFLNN